MKKDDLEIEIEDGPLTIKLPTGMPNGYTYEIHRGPSLKTDVCDHKWVDVGFAHSKIVCYHCDVEQK